VHGISRGAGRGRQRRALDITQAIEGLAQGVVVHGCLSTGG
jgi:hypothetical protein